MSKEFFQVHPLAPSCHDQSWKKHMPDWAKLGKDMNIDHHYSPLTIKALYVTGIIISCGRSVNVLMNSGELISTVFYPAYALFAAMIDLLGRCLAGNDVTRTSDMLKAGFMWLAQPSSPEYLSVNENEKVISTKNFEYSIQDLINVRHFSAHGQATLYRDALKDFDYLLLEQMPGKLADAIQAYLNHLVSNLTIANCLAWAAIKPYRSRPIFDALWTNNMELTRFAESVADQIRVFDWRYRIPDFGIGSN